MHVVYKLTKKLNINIAIAKAPLSRLYGKRPGAPFA